MNGKEQAKALQDRIDSMMDDVFKTLGKAGPLSGEERDKALGDLKNADKLANRRKRLADDRPAVPLVRRSTTQAYDSRSVGAREMAGRIWDTGQKRLEKDAADIAKNTKNMKNAIESFTKKPVVQVEIVNDGGG